MEQCKKEPNPRRQEKEEESNWSELSADLLRCVFKRLNFISLNRAKLVCSWWYSASKGCIPNQQKNQIPWLILFPPNEENNNNNNRCVLFDPEDKENLYRSKDLGDDFGLCLAICGSWLLMFNDLHSYYYILNPITRERIDLPDLPDARQGIKYCKDDVCCFWIDSVTKDYLVITGRHIKFTKKGYKIWHELPLEFKFCDNIFYNAKKQKVYVHVEELVHIVDLSGDEAWTSWIGALPNFEFNHDDFSCFFNTTELYWKEFKAIYSRMIVTLSRDFLMVSCLQDKHDKLRYFRIYKLNHVDEKWEKIDSLGDEALIYDMGIINIYKLNHVDYKWEKIDSLGDEALIYDMGITVINIPGIKRNSIFVGSKYYGSEPFVYDLTTHQKESLPQCVLSSMLSSKARWFFPTC